MSRFNKKQSSIAKVVEQQRAGIGHRLIPTVVLTSKQSADRFGKTDSFWWEKFVDRTKPKFHWQAFNFRKMSQRQKRKRFRQACA